MRKIVCTSRRIPRLAGFTFILAGSLFCSTGSLSANEPVQQNRIIGGDTVTRGANPWVVSLGLTQISGALIDKHFCGGTIIDSRWILTAAHCVYNEFGVIRDPSEIQIATGVNDLFTDTSRDEGVISNIVAHPGYDPTNPRVLDDIALLETANELIMPAMNYYTGETNPILGLDATVTGWGVIDVSNPQMPIADSVLREVNVPIVPLSFCNLPDSYNNELQLGHICAGLDEGGADSCQGDSGGPLFMSINGVDTVVGVVSFGAGCGQPRLYGVYASVSRYRTFISSFVSGELTPVDTSENYILRGDDIQSGSLNLLGLFVLLVSYRVRRMKKP